MSQRSREPREELEDAVLVPVLAGAGAPAQAAQHQVLGNAHAGEQAAPLGHVADAEAGDLRRAQADKVAPAVLDGPAGRRRGADDALEQRRFAGPVAAQQGDDLPLVQVERHVADDVALAVEHVRHRGRHHQALPAALSRGRAAMAEVPEPI